jgi:Sulfocyanin (SoxE).
MQTDTEHKPASANAALRVTAIVSLVLLVAVGIALGLGAWARRHAEDAVFKGTEKIEVHESSFRIELSETTIRSGKVGFDVHNNASVPHEFVVFKTDLDADDLPLGKDGDVVEDSPELKDVADIGSSIGPGHSRALFATLTPGHYAVVCNLPAHYHQGMHIDLTVTAG